MRGPKEFVGNGVRFCVRKLAPRSDTDVNPKLDVMDCDIVTGLTMATKNKNGNNNAIRRNALEKLRKTRHVYIETVGETKNKNTRVK